MYVCVSVGGIIQVMKGGYTCIYLCKEKYEWLEIEDSWDEVFNYYSVWHHIPPFMNFFWIIKRQCEMEFFVGNFNWSRQPYLYNMIILVWN